MSAPKEEERIQGIRPTISYRLIRKIAGGGMAAVYEGEEPELKRRVAVKILKDGADPRAIRMLHREAMIAAQLRHPNIVAVHEGGLGQDPEGRPLHFMVMDYVEGRTLADLLRWRKTPCLTLLRIFQKVAGALAYAHERGITHRDLKPSNVLVDPAGEVFLTDFGLAWAKWLHPTLTPFQVMMGTPRYMAPEQVRGKQSEMGPATDVFSLGVLLYEILTGSVPFTARSIPRLFGQILRESPELPRLKNPGIDPDLEAVCLKAMEKNPFNRYANAGELAAELGRILTKGPHPLPEDSLEKAVFETRKPARKRSPVPSE